MRRTELEKRLAALGWAPTGQMSGERHAVWRHRGHRLPIHVPIEDLVKNAVADRLLDEAAEG